MNAKQLIVRIQKEYKKAKKPLIATPMIARKTSHTISSIIEDLVAYYFSNIIRKDLKILIDPQISVNGLKNKTGNKKLLFRPDICIMKNDVVKAIFDIKTDLGYKRSEFIRYAKDRVKELNKIKKNNKGCSLKDDDKEIQSVKIDDNLKWIYIVVSDDNINKDQFIKIENEIGTMSDVELFTLVKGEHPRKSDINILKFINMKDIVSLEKCLKGIK